MNPFVFAALVGYLCYARTGDAWSGLLVGILVVTMYVVWAYLMAERETRKALEDEDADSEE